MSKRVEQMNETFKRAVSEFINRELELPRGILITISKVIVSKNMKNAKIFISVFPANKRGSVLKILNSSIKSLDEYLAANLRLRHIPKINYSLDTSEDAVEEIEEIVREIHKI